jgi:hypothetical protein
MMTGHESWNTAPRNLSPVAEVPAGIRSASQFSMNDMDIWRATTNNSLNDGVQLLADREDAMFGNGFAFPKTEDIYKN